MTAAPASLPGRWPKAGFGERIGRAILFPQQATRALGASQPGGLRDAALLFLPRLLISDVQRMTLELTQLGDGGARSIVTVLLDAASALLPDVLGILLGGVLMSVALGQRERLLRPGLTIDISAQAWLGWLFVQVLAALGQTLWQHEPGARFRAALPWVAFAVWVLYILIGFLTLRRMLAEQSGATAATPRETGDTG
jgi:hypothetical protein